MEQIEFFSFEDQVWYMKNGEQSPRKDVISHRAACAEFGRDKIDFFIKNGLVNRTKGTARNSKIQYSRTEILEAMKAINLQNIVTAGLARVLLRKGGKEARNEELDEVWSG